MLVVLAVCCRPAAAAAQEERPAVVVRSDALEIRIGGQVQTQFNTSSDDEVPETEWLVRRARLNTRVRLNDVVSGRIQAEFAGSQPSLVEAFVRLRLGRAAQVTMGRAYRPFGLLEQTASTRILPIERGLQLRGAGGFDQFRVGSALGYSGRDVGLQMTGEAEAGSVGLGYAVGVFRGPSAAAVDVDGTRQVAARVTVSPSPTLTLGGGWSVRDFARGPVGATGVELRTGRAFEIDAAYGAEAEGLRLLAEVSTGDVDPFADAAFRGAQLWAGYRAPALSAAVTGWEPVLRFSHARVDGERGGTLLTPGLNLYLGGWNRVMLNYDVWIPASDGGAARSFKVQLQLAF